ncbi:hypothetical protein [Streptomyces albireticuli]|uniref:Replication protein n=1 Tax=Streptomyces albireticuli TaxID=1940 RepID=A0A2A2D1S9_9ACTN|nr:hypothetical protein [Streptomyces albireticuli]MCD9196382.1 hypothetical protein [Streptomyces albireticuli]PAU45292.1 hypothetical protein CK936_30225 [Streptomyces albireticuli]
MDAASDDDCAEVGDGESSDAATPAVPLQRAEGHERGGKRQGPKVDGKVVRDELYRLREKLQKHKILLDRAFNRCAVFPRGAGGVPVRVNPTTRRAVVGGLCYCRRVHTCPSCMTTIRSYRAEEWGRYATLWENAGRGIVLLTLTLRHFDKQGLGSIRKGNRFGLLDVQHRAWERLIGRRAPSSFRTKRWRNHYGIEGYLRVWECTHGRGRGWHPHWHVMVFTAAPWTRTMAKEFEAEIRERWGRAVIEVGGYEINEHGAKVDLPKPGDGKKLGVYLFKNQDGKAKFEGLSQEVVRGDKKQGRGGNRMILEIMNDAVNTLDKGDEAAAARDVELIREYEESTRDLKLMFSTPRLRELLAELAEIEEKTDGQILTEAEEGKLICMFLSEVWYEHVTRIPGRFLAVIHAAEERGEPAVRRLVESWGLVWGRDVIPAGDVRIPEQTPKPKKTKAEERAEVEASKKRKKTKVETVTKTLKEKATAADGARATDQKRQDEVHRLGASMADDDRRVAGEALEVRMATRRVERAATQYVDTPPVDRDEVFDELKTAITHAQRIEKITIDGLRDGHHGDPTEFLAARRRVNETRAGDLANSMRAVREQWDRAEQGAEIGRTITHPRQPEEGADEPEAVRAG